MSLAADQWATGAAWGTAIGLAGVTVVVVCLVIAIFISTRRG